MPYAVKKREFSLSYCPQCVNVAGARGFNTNLLTVEDSGARDVQGAVRVIEPPEGRSRPFKLADSQRSALATKPPSFSLDWRHSVIAQKSFF